MKAQGRGSGGSNSEGQLLRGSGGGGMRMMVLGGVGSWKFTVIAGADRRDLSDLTAFVSPRSERPSVTAIIPTGCPAPCAPKFFSACSAAPAAPRHMLQASQVESPNTPYQACSHSSVHIELQYSIYSMQQCWPRLKSVPNVLLADANPHAKQIKERNMKRRTSVRYEMKFRAYDIHWTRF